MPVLPVAEPGAAVSPGTSNCSFTNAPGLTVTAGLVPAVLAPSVRSEAVKVREPAVLNVMLRVWVPETKGTFGGKPALPSLDVIPTVSVTVLTVFQKLSTALTVMLKAAPALCAVGVPVLPVAVPGAAISPGTNSWSFAKAAGLTAMLPEVAAVRPVAVKLRLMVVARLWDRFANVATPLTAVAVKVPCRVPLPALRATVTTVLLSLERRLPKASRIRIAGAGENVAPAFTVAGGCVCMAKLAAGPGFTVKTALVALLRPDALAVSCLSAPVASIRRLLNVTAPLPAAVPMSKDAVPCNGPVPPVRLRFKFRLAGRPAVEALPNWSSVRTTGWLPKTEPAVALPGCVVKVKRLALAAPTAIGDEVEGVTPVLVNWIVMLAATLCERLVNVTVPSAAVVIPVVPCKVPLPARRAAVTTVLSGTVPSPMPLASLRTLPN